MAQSGDTWPSSYWICHMPHTTNKQMNQNMDTLTQQDSEVVIHQNSKQKSKRIPRHCSILMVLEAEGQKGLLWRLTSGLQGRKRACVDSSASRSPHRRVKQHSDHDVPLFSMFRKTWFNSPISLAWGTRHTQKPVVAMVILLCDGI